MRLGSTALVEKPKFGDVMTPEGRLRLDPSIWLTNVNLGTRIRLTQNAQGAFFPSWSPDARIVFNTQNIDNTSLGELYIQSSDGSGDLDTLLTSVQGALQLPHWSSDGQFVVYTVMDVTRDVKEDIWYVPVAGDRTPHPDAACFER